MKTLVALFLVSFLVSTGAQAGSSARAIRMALAKSAKDSRPAIAETDIFNALGKASRRAEPNQMGPKTPLVNMKLSSQAHFEAHFAVNNRNGVTTLSLEARDLTTHQVARLKHLINDQDWKLIGNINPRIDITEIGSTSFAVELDFAGLKQQDLNNLRGIKKLVDVAIKIAAEDSRIEKSAAIFSRKNAMNHISLGAK